MSDDFLNILAKTAKVEIVEKKMKALLIIKESDNLQTPPFTCNYIKELLSTAGVVYGIKEDVIQDLVDGKITDEKITVAEGIEPLQGEDAQLEYYFSIESSLKPQLLEDGHIDYKEVNLIHSIEKDAPLVRKIPATVGRKGTDVFGNEIPGIPGKDINFVMGQGTVRDPQDAFLLRSGLDGVIHYDPKTHNVEIQRLFVVQGSVDYSTGNVHVKSAVDIKEDVKAGFSIQTPYNVDIRGGVEQATITCDGTLKVKGGINGDSKQIIKTGGDLHAGYIANQIIKCGGSVFVASELRNSIIECDDEVVVVKSGGVIIGGKTTATNKITSPSIGNTYHIPTEVEVGLVLKHKDKYLRKVAQRNEVQRLMEELKKKISVIADKPASNAKTAQLATIKDIWAKCIGDLERLKNETEEVEKAYYNVSDPAVFVTKTVYPHTIIKIKNRSYEVIEELSHVVFKLVGDEIVHSSIK